MKCTFCAADTRVVDKRAANDGRVTRRRRECQKCEKRFTTYERVETQPVIVVKKDGRREPFDRNKLRTGLMKACEKRPIGQDIIEKTVNDIEDALRRKDAVEIKGNLIGNMVMRKLRRIDNVAYIRYASVYQEYEDITSFEEELKRLKNTKGT
ncbi:MAG: transcriptional regulator NrdR [Nanoarchaeota archaeon]|nr:transcriptional regulator NrdR [Nanoarchaeota archaeon]